MDTIVNWLNSLHSETRFVLQAAILVAVPFAIWKRLPVSRIRTVKDWMPLVVVQILLGIALGPGVLGNWALALYAPDAFFGSSQLAPIKGLAWLALVLFGFTTGLHFDVEALRGKGKAFAITALAATLVPFAGGFGLGYYLFGAFPELVGKGADVWAYSLGMGIACGVTALPVLSAILGESNVIETRDGKLALGLATVSDGLLWVFVAVLAVLMQGSGHAAEAHGEAGGIWSIVKVVGLFGAYLAFMIFFARRILERLVVSQKQEEQEERSGGGYVQGVTPKGRSLLALSRFLTAGDLVKVGGALFISALATDLIGVHFLLGAFVFGAIFPKTAVLRLRELGDGNGHHAEAAQHSIAMDAEHDNEPGVEVHSPVNRFRLRLSEEAAEGTSVVRLRYSIERSTIAHEIEGKLMPVLGVFLLPFFFMSTGLRTNFSLASAAVWAIFALSVVVSAATKFVGTYLPARRIPGLTSQDACYLGGLMQCKGLMEVVVLTILLQAGVITESAFSGLLFMAVFTTAVTMPVMKWIKPGLGQVHAHSHDSDGRMHIVTTLPHGQPALTVVPPLEEDRDAAE